jgi:hypothetical protein
MLDPLVIPAGGKMLLSDPVVEWNAAVFSDTIPPSVVMTASIQAGPAIPIFPNMGTTLGVQMEASVAMRLYEQLHELARRSPDLLLHSVFDEADCINQLAAELFDTASKKASS